MPWQRRSDGFGERNGAPDCFTPAQLAALRALEADVSRSIEIAGHLGATAAPRHGDQGYFLRLADDLMAELAQERAQKHEPGRRRCGQESVTPRELQRTAEAGHGAIDLACLLRDVERKLTTRGARVDAVDRTAFAA